MPLPRAFAPYLRFFRSPRKQLRQGMVRLLRSPGAPNEIAGGLALGIFVAFLPIMGIQMGVAIVCAEAIRLTTGLKLSRIAAAAGVWLTNPLTAAPVYGVCYLLGRPVARLLVPQSMPTGTAGGAELVQEAAASGHFGLGLLVALVAGGVLLGVPAAILTFFGTRRLVRRYGERRRARRPTPALAPPALPGPEASA